MEFLLVNKTIEALENKLVMLAYNLDTTPKDLVENTSNYSNSMQKRINSIVSELEVFQEFKDESYGA